MVSSSTLHSSMLDELGAEIVAGDLAPGEVVTLEALQERYGVSRSTARDCVRTLETLSMVQIRKRTGVTIAPASQWNVFDSNVIRWRLDNREHREEQLRSLVELRLGVEPIAASLASVRSTTEERQELRSIAERMRRYGDAGKVSAYLAADMDFHAAILRFSRNQMLAALGEPVSEVLRVSPSHGRTERYPVPETIAYHEAVMEQIVQGRPDQAEAAMVLLLGDVRAGLHLE